MGDSGTGFVLVVPEGRRRLRRSRHGAVLAAVLVGLVGVIVLIWPYPSGTLSYTEAQDKTMKSLDAAMFTAIERFPDPAVTTEDYTPCAGDQGRYSMDTHTVVTGVTLNDASQDADKLASFLRSNGYAYVTDDRSAASVTVSGLNYGVTTAMHYQAGGLAFSATTGCDVKP